MEQEVPFGFRPDGLALLPALLILALTGGMTSATHPLLHYSVLSTEVNVWVTWASQTNNPDFCLSLQSAGEPFRTCLIEWPGYNLTDFSRFSKDALHCAKFNDVATQSACLIMSLNNSLPWDPQELDLLGSRRVDNPKGRNTTCLLFGQGTIADKVAYLYPKLWDLRPYYKYQSWTPVLPHNKEAFNWHTYCGGDFSLENAYGMHLTETLVNSGSAKALPHGIFLICGDRARAGIPKNVVGGPCYLGKLTLFAPKQQQWLTIDSKLRNASHEELLSLQILDSTCSDEVQLWSVTARIFASFLAPGVAAAQALKQIERLACWTVEQSNHTSEILEEMLEDMNSLRHAVLQNRAAIDFLLLAQGHGCKDFDGMCCFNLSDHSESIQKQIHWLLNHTRSITKDHNPIDDWLHSVFPELTPWVYDMIKEGVKWILIIILLVIVVRILYSCLLRATAPKAALIVTDNKDQDIIHDWLQDQGGHNPSDCFVLQP